MTSLETLLVCIFFEIQINKFMNDKNTFTNKINTEWISTPQIDICFDVSMRVQRRFKVQEKTYLEL